MLDTGESYEDEDVSYEDDELGDLGEGLDTTQHYQEDDLDGPQNDPLTGVQRSPQAEEMGVDPGAVLQGVFRTRLLM